ncbi:MAG TPA: TIGR00730 family Rossman fold protein [Spirochaetota bacterium]|nr:TIGR00730 family Rossman fold protein [Spirochaetota bacterium]
MKNLCVFCGSSAGNNPVYRETALQLGRYMVSNSINLVYGGGDVGLMGILSSTVMENGGHVTGIIPELLHAMVPHRKISELIVVRDMHERKSLMYRMSDAFLCMPGGIGSLDELMESFTWLQLGYHNKPVCVLNVNGYYSGLLAQLKFMAAEGFLREEHLSSLLVSENIEGLMELLKSFRYKASSKISELKD